MSHVRGAAPSHTVLRRNSPRLRIAGRHGAQTK